MIGYRTHLFVCTNSPDKESKCGGKGSEHLRKELKDLCKKEFGKEVRVNSSGCLGHCEHGICAVIYPAGEWLLDLKKKDTDFVMEKIRKHQKNSQ